MTEMLDLALTYGGFTSLDRVYLQNRLKEMTKEEQRRFLTPPPSVINAYFAELYQKDSPKVATDYYFKLSQAFALFPDKPSFAEDFPFVRLALFDQAYGFAYLSDEGVAQIFAEGDLVIEAALILEVAKIFPHYQVFIKDGKLLMQELLEEQEVVSTTTPEDFPLVTLEELTGGLIRLSSYDHREVWAWGQEQSGQVYYQFRQRQLQATVLLKPARGRRN